MIKFSYPFNLLLVATLAVMVKFVVTEIMKLVVVKTMRPDQVEKRYEKNLNAENTIQNICIFRTRRY
jgi:hypothetical protein